jgi:hypothetical protein
MAIEPSQGGLEAAARLARLAVIDTLARRPFKGGGLSDQTINVLVAADIDAPERLLFMPESEIKKIAGLSKVATAQISAYRGKFIP